MIKCSSISHFFLFDSVSKDHLQFIIISKPIKLLLFKYKSMFPVVKMLCSDILRFADLRLENNVRVNGINFTKEKQKLLELARSLS